MSSNANAKPLDINFSSGLRQDLESKLAPPGALVQADNVEFDSLNRLVRRDGFASLTLTKVSKSTDVSFPVRRMAQGPEGEQLIFTDQNTHVAFTSGVNGTTAASIQGVSAAVRAALTDVDGIVGDEVGNLLFTDCIAVGQWLIYLYVQTNVSTSQIEVCSDVIDAVTNARVLTRAVVGTTAGSIQPRLTSVGGSTKVFAIWHNTGGTINYSILDTSFPGGVLAWGASANLVTDAAAIPVFDACELGTGWVFVYSQTATGTRPVIKTLDSTASVTHTLTWKTASGAADWTPTALTIMGDAIGGGAKVHAAGYDSVNFKIEALTCTNALSTVLQTSTDPGLDHAKAATQMAIGRKDTTHTELAFSNYTSTTLSTNPRGHLYCYTIPDSSVLALDQAFANYSLGSRFYRDSRNGGCFCVGRFDDPSGFQNHMLLLDFGNSATGGSYGAPIPVLHFASGRVPLKTDNSFTGVGGIADLASVQPGRFMCAVLLNSSASQNSGNQVVAYELESLNSKRYLSTPCQFETVVGGGTPLTYDGQRLVELSFYSYPVMASGNYTPSAAGGLMAQGKYQYRAVYEWTDARGNRHQSPASPAVTVDMSSGTYAANTNQVSMAVPALHATRKQTFGVDVTVPVMVVFYRTVANSAGPFYRCLGGAVNTTTSATDGTYSDSSTDGFIATQEVLYTQGGGRGELATTAPPPSLVLTTHAQRLWGVDCENPERIWCTKVLSDLTAPGYNQGLQIEIPGAGRINGIGAQDGKLYALATNGIYLASYGDGPDNAGGGVFPSPQLITVTANAQDPRGVFGGQDGIFFTGIDQWGTGIYLIRRGDAQPISIGKRVRSILASYPVCKGIVNRTAKARTEFMFTDAEVATKGVILYYHHDYVDQEGIGQWTCCVLPDQPECIATWNDISVIADSSAIGIQTLGTLRDFGANVPIIEIATADLRPFGLVGYGQITNATILGTVSTIDPITIELSYDSGQTWPDAFSWQSTPEGTAGATILRQFQSPTSKLPNGGSMRVRLSDPTVVDTGPGISFFHGISIEIMPLGGNARLSNAQRG